MSRLTKGYLIAIIGITVWSTTGIFIDYLVTLYHMPALLLALWRNVLVCVALVPALFFFRRSLLYIDRSQIGFYIFYGIILAVFNSIWTLSVKANGAAVATVLAYSSAGFTAILALWLFREKLGIPKIVAVILSLGGCVLVSDAYRRNVEIESFSRIDGPAFGITVCSLHTNRQGSGETPYQCMDIHALFVCFCFCIYLDLQFVPWVARCSIFL
jgi:drug/metabolite transporter (DMT)-like permease